jgi:hypothetical protein
MEQCEKNRLIRKERSDEITAALSGVILLGEEQWDPQEDHRDMMRAIAWFQGDIVEDNHWSVDQWLERRHQIAMARMGGEYAG